MIKIILKKILILFFALFVLITLTFVLMKCAPGDPFSEEQAMRQDMQDLLLKQHGFTQSWLQQYITYFYHLSHFEMGYSLKYPDQRVNMLIQDSFPISARLGLQAFILALFGGLFLGTWTAIYSTRWHRYSMIFFTTLGLSIPSFLLAALLQYGLAIYFPIFPIARWGSFMHTILPTIALAVTPLAFITRLVYSTLKEVFKTDYIKLVKAKGLPLSYWLWRHALPHTFIPILGFSGQLLANILVGSFVIEKIFSIPGLGQWLVTSIASRDYPLIMGLTLFYSTVLLISIFVADLLICFCDKRIGVSQSGNHL